MAEATLASEVEFTFFWKNNSPFSQWYKSKFTVDDIVFNCAEQFMMYQKAVLFNDWEAAKKILKTQDPRLQKKLGRTVKNFNEQTWNENCREIVRKGNMAKFSQNADLKAVLLATGDTVLVEASPYDCIWGIGLTEDDPRARDKSQWKGTNWLGYALTDLKNNFAKNKMLAEKLLCENISQTTDAYNSCCT